jgi:hypothetical protein
LLLVVRVVAEMTNLERLLVVVERVALGHPLVHQVVAQAPNLRWLLTQTPFTSSQLALAGLAVLLKTKALTEVILFFHLLPRQVAAEAAAVLMQPAQVVLVVVHRMRQQQVQVERLIKVVLVVIVLLFKVAGVVAVQAQ